MYELWPNYENDPTQGKHTHMHTHKHSLTHPSPIYIGTYWQSYSMKGEHYLISFN